MKFIATPPNSRKTTDLIEICHNAPGTYMVVPTRDDATRVFHYAIKLGKPIPFPITYEDYLQGRWSRRGIAGFVFDDVDRFLADYSKGLPLLAATATNEP